MVELDSGVAAAMTREQLVEAFEASEKRRTALNRRRAEYMRRRRLRDPEYFRQRAAEAAAYSRQRYKDDPAFREAVISRVADHKARNAALASLRHLFAEPGDQPTTRRPVQTRL